ncbi:MFS transporter [Pontibacter sp. BT310]|uniref:MFS transporter n=1 Tax=Pontibacter populi TaxID=890055 RepID=A0ABS6XDS5_9BACT|nr:MULTISPECIES: MFS transporter [Pontibacter]MBJ6118819.1 MFS transporter [Pontibacter sp. BT310]MBR0571247.1 MFS transporter [Microvirga sp. STS03]MBW3365673.1 MFS transporter [Pontibacter populi]
MKLNNEHIETAEPDIEDHVPKKEIREGLLIFTLAAIQFTHMMDFVIMMPLGPQLMRVFNISPSEFGLLVSAYTFSAAVAGFLSALFIDRFDRKHAMLGLYLGFTLGTLACALAPTFVMLLVARVLAGAFGGVLGALILAVIGDAIPEHRRGAATGKVMAAFSVASIAGIPVGLYLASISSWHAPFYLLAGLSFIVLLASFKLLPPMRGHLTNAVKQNPFLVLKEILQKRNLQWAMTLMVTLTMSGFLVVPFISPYMVANVGFSETELSYIYLFGGIATVFTSQWAGRLADKHGKHRVFIISAVLSIVPILLITNLPPVPHYVALIVSTVFFIFFGARFVPAMSLITSSVEPKLRGSFMSINSSVQQLSAGTAAFISGLIVAEGADGKLLYFGWDGVLACLVTLIAIWVVRHIKTVG